VGRRLRFDPSRGSVTGDEPGFLERYLLDDDSWIHARGHRTVAVGRGLLDPAHVLARLIVLDGADADIRNLWDGLYYVRVTVRGIRSRTGRGWTA